jgi:hypothetical protein
MVGTQFCHVVLRVKDLLDLHGQGLESALHLGTLTSTSASVSILTVRLALARSRRAAVASRAAANAAASSVPAAALKFPDVCER